MIGKHIPPGKIRSKNSYCRAVISYIVRPENSGQEKCAVWGCAHVLMDETPEQVIREMVATASMDISSPNPFVHFVFALAPGEEFDGKQIAVVARLLKELDAVGLQALWGEHIDTDHRHLHVFINRVDPDTGDLRDINQRYYTKMAHRAAAVVSDAFGFSQPQNALYEVQNGKASRREKPHADDPRTGISAKPLPAWVYAWEEKHGTEHPWRTGQKVFLDTLTQAATWDDLSVTLLEQGYYIKESPGKKNAHVLMLPRYEHPIKLSAISRAVSYNNLQRIFDVVSQQAEVLHEPSTITATTPVLLKLTPQQFEAIKNSQAKVAQMENRMLHLEATVKTAVGQMQEYLTTFQQEVEAAKKGSLVPDETKQNIVEIWEAIHQITEQLEQLLE